MWYNILSYVIISVSGLKPERFVNICARRNIKLWGIKRIDKDTIVMCVSSTDFRKRIRPVAFKARCKVRILEKKGLIIKLYRYRKRKVLAASFAVGIMLTMLLCSMLWSIRIEGATPIEEMRTRLVLSSMGIRPGVFMHNIDNSELADTLMDNQPGIAWVGVRKRGIVLEITLAKRQEYNDKGTVPDDVHCDVVAKKDAVVSKIVPEQGTALVTIDTTVTKGQKLIAGWVVQMDEEGKEHKRPVHARGIVKGIVWHSVEIPIETQHERIVATGKEKTLTTINFFGINIGLPGKKNPYDSYSSVTFEQYLTLPSGKEMPMGIVKTKIMETRKETVILSYEEALEATRLRAMELIDNMIPDDADILETFFEIRKTEEGVFLYMACECEENIGVEVAVGD
ncbi:MAG TPA: sporulation protein YqfD [Clostridiaceae bacterium]|jgi:similar to stage IV sporulation protein|nr:sporulation protein YqfD [Clostridiaceae bacterium]